VKFRSGLLALLPAAAAVALLVVPNRPDDDRPADRPFTPPGPSLAGKTRHRPLEMRRLGPERWEVNAAEIQAFFAQAGRTLPDVSVTVEPAFSLGSRTRYWVTSEAVDGILTDQGFLVTDPKLAEAAGIEAGDIIVTVQGHPVSALHAVMLALRRDPDRRTFVVEIDRRGARITQTYRLR
jgi:hypothetical protein